MTEANKAQIRFIKDCLVGMNKGNFEDLQKIALETIDRLNSDLFDVHDFKELTQEEKTEIITGFTKLTAGHALSLFKSLGLKTHFECMVIDDNTKEEYILSLKKV